VRRRETKFVDRLAPIWQYCPPMGKRRKASGKMQRANARLARGDFTLPTPAEIEAAASHSGAWTAAQLAEWGVRWPPQKGWRAELERQWMDRHPEWRPAPVATAQAEQQVRYLRVPYAEKDRAKVLGARWNATRRQWWVPADVAPEPFERWLIEVPHDPDPMDMRMGTLFPIDRR
jgi:hypothetical protein